MSDLGGANQASLSPTKNAPAQQVIISTNVQLSFPLLLIIFSSRYYRPITATKLE